MGDQEQSFERLEQFSNVDQSSEQAMFIAFLVRVEQLPDVRARRARSIDLLDAGPGHTLLDVGCGIGTAVLEAERRFGASTRCEGVDLSAVMIEEARRRAAEAGSPAVFHLASADRLPHADASLDGYRAERVYQHLGDPMAALAEARRCLRPGGRIVLVDQDWDLCVFDGDDLAAGRAVTRAFANSLANGTVGRQHRRLLRDAGFHDVSVTAEAVTSASGDDYGFMPALLEKAALAGGLDGALVARWADDQKRRIAEDGFFMTMTHFIAVARR